MTSYSMLVTSQLPIQTTHILYSFFDVHLWPPLWIRFRHLRIRSLTFINLHARDSHKQPSRLSHTPIYMWVTSTVGMSTVVTTKHLLTVRAWTPGQHPTALDCCMTQRKQQVSPLTDGTLAPTGPGLREFRPGQLTAGQTCSRKVPAVTTTALPHNTTKTQGACPQRSGEALELSQGWLEALPTSHRWIH